jgi:hypothetical protein
MYSGAKHGKADAVEPGGIGAARGTRLERPPTLRALRT